MKQTKFLSNSELRRNPLLGCVLLLDASQLISSGCHVGRVTYNDKAHRKAFPERARFDTRSSSASKRDQAIRRDRSRSCFARKLTARFMSSSESPSPLNQIDDEDDDSNYEQEMDQAAANVAEQAKKPEH